MLAAYHGHHDVARTLLERGADPELRNDRGQSPLAGAAFKGDVAMVDLLVKAGADVDAAGPDGRTALQCAEAMGAARAADRLSGPASASDPRTAPNTKSP